VLLLASRSVGKVIFQITYRYNFTINYHGNTCWVRIYWNHIFIPQSPNCKYNYWYYNFVGRYANNHI